MSEVEFVDSLDILSSLRMIKSPEEIRRIKKACDILCSASEEGIEHIHEGMTEKEVAAKFGSIIMEKGAENLLIVFSPCSFPSDHILKSGDMIRIDPVCCYDGYWADIGIHVIIGKPSQKQMDFYNLALKAHQDAIEILKPGIKASDVNKITIGVYKEAGYRIAVRAGHGIGLDIHEPPYFSIKDSTILKPGMIFDLEPGIITEEGAFSIEQLVLITEDGYEILSTHNLDLISI